MVWAVTLRADAQPVGIEFVSLTLLVSTTFPLSARPGAAPIGATMAAMASARAAAGAKARRITEYLFLKPHPPIQSQAARPVGELRKYHSGPRLTSLNCSRR